ncbi:hypothetical protein CRG98_026066 [Punica granatum]|uniref:Uncharacterized protein n=1 Tax=Punica granatum TaxID=22663 RepID=A0A2I0JBA1_PUNGR|nr:hypothetical protein CRG98_026066 [Punica granatum]
MAGRPVKRFPEREREIRGLNGHVSFRREHASKCRCGAPPLLARKRGGGGRRGASGGECTRSRDFYFAACHAKYAPRGALFGPQRTWCSRGRS